ncbi:unnamed protein product [Miscanthus lutarioriparius]|uniref:Uncharacterized protein n=1 Tax=Miscanthus lutarioriparius TaxID=422564 RepID=A0A811QL31_9POAL|nr:unnamed protein product [Miscanthus lutarioriparius]
MEIPLSDGDKLRNLQRVDMSSNSFTGHIQASIFSQPALQYLDLRYNHLSGHIEEFQKPSTMLEEIYLSNNKLNGTIPTSFSQLSALTKLELGSNNFLGTLDLYPYLMLRNLSVIRASNNPLLSVSAEDHDDGSNNSSIIDTLELASCGLTRVPSVLKYLPKLNYHDLSNNSIHGNIPDWIWRNKTFLYLQHNLFTKVGQLPAYTFIDSYMSSTSATINSGALCRSLTQGRNLDWLKFNYTSHGLSSLSQYTKAAIRFTNRGSRRRGAGMP